MIGFSSLFLHFAYKLLFDQEHVNDETCRWGLFISGLFAFISGLIQVQRLDQQRVQQQLELKDNRLYAKDKNLLNAHLKESLRKVMIAE